MAAALRFAALLGVWTALAGTAWPAWPPGIAAAALGAWWSLHLLPPGPLRIRPGALLALLARFPWQAATAGVQVARLALDPRRRPEPAFVPWSPRLPPGRGRDAFLAYASLLPGTLPAGDAPGGAVMLHAIAGAEAAAATMTAEEARFARAFGLDA